MSLLNGGSIDDIKPGIDFLAAHRDQVAMFQSSDTTARKALASGEIIAMLGSPSAVKELSDQGIKVAMVCPKPTPLIFEGMMIVSNGNVDAAAAFINTALSTEWQTHMTNVYNLAPVNPAAAPAPALVSELPTPENAVKFDEAKINQNLGAWTEQFNAAVAQ
jgi:putative spermidine/putrescine transport system substrate-binding protein